MKPGPKHSIDRIDNNGDYSAKNCRWSTKKEQVNNRRNNRLITIASVTLTIAQWENKMGYGRGVIRNRLNKGWSEFDAVMTPVNGKIRLITIASVTLTIAQWTEKKGYGKTVIQSRLDRGWSEFDAVMTPVKQRKSA